MTTTTGRRPAGPASVGTADAGTLNEAGKLLRRGGFMIRRRGLCRDDYAPRDPETGSYFADRQLCGYAAVLWACYEHQWPRHLETRDLGPAVLAAFDALDEFAASDGRANWTRWQADRTHDEVAARLDVLGLALIGQSLLADVAGGESP